MNKIDTPETIKVTLQLPTEFQGEGLEYKVYPDISIIGFVIHTHNVPVDEDGNLYFALPYLPAEEKE
jgi:hypothetical protein